MNTEEIENVVDDIRKAYLKTIRVIDSVNNANQFEMARNYTINFNDWAVRKAETIPTESSVLVGYAKGLGYATIAYFNKKFGNASV